MEAKKKNKVKRKKERKKRPLTLQISPYFHVNDGRYFRFHCTWIAIDLVLILKRVELNSALTACSCLVVNKVVSRTNTRLPAPTDKRRLLCMKIRSEFFNLWK